MLSGPGQHIFFLSFFLSVWFLKNSGKKKGKMQFLAVRLAKCFETQKQLKTKIVETRKVKTTPTCFQRQSETTKGTFQYKCIVTK
jgi:hypothetical protein